MVGINPVVALTSNSEELPASMIAEYLEKTDT
jgi:hypothetical protein